MKTPHHETPNNNIVRIALGTAAALLVPVLGRWPWELNDYVVMGILLFSVGCTLDLITKKLDERYRIPAGIAVLGIGFLIWAELSVGVLENIWLMLFGG